MQFFEPQPILPSLVAALLLVKPMRQVTAAAAATPGSLIDRRHHKGTGNSTVGDKEGGGGSVTCKDTLLSVQISCSPQDLPDFCQCVVGCQSGECIRDRACQEDCVENLCRECSFLFSGSLPLAFLEPLLLRIWLPEQELRGWIVCLNFSLPKVHPNHVH